MKLFLNFEKTSMMIAIDKLSFADYCSYTDGSDRRYELVDGESIPKTMIALKNSVGQLKERNSI